MKMKLAGYAATLISMSTLSLGLAFGQATSGEVVGTVKDAAGALVPNASVTITEESTQVVKNLKTNASGQYRVGNLLPGVYDIKIEAAGFQGSVLKGVAVQVGQTVTEDSSLSISSGNTTVEVQATAGVTLDTTSTNLTTSFDAAELNYIPTATSGNGVLNVALLAPNVSSPGGAGIGTGPSVGGQRSRNNNYTVEGVDDNSKSVTGPLIEIPNDAVGDFTLITSQFSPEFGHSSGGQFNTTVRSGTNHFHGKIYEYFDNRNLNAQNAIQGGKVPTGIPRYDFNRYGGQIGGPILRNKLFFFANYERSTLGQSGNSFICTPTAAGLATLTSLGTSYGFRATNLTEYTSLTPVANVAGGAQVTSVAGAANFDHACQDTTGLQYLTVTNNSPTAAGLLSTNIPLGNAQLTPPSFQNTNQYTGSVDYTPTQKDSFRFRYSQLKAVSIDTVASLPVFQGSTGPHYFLGTGSWFHTLSPNLVNELRIGFNRYNSPTPVYGPSFPGLNAFPNLTIFDAGIDIGPDDNAPQSTVENLYQLTDNVTYTKGRHTFKFGFDGRKQIAPQVFVQRQRGDYEWTGLDYYLHDLAPDYFGERSAGASTYYGDQTNFYGYGNDTWRVTPKLTLNYGLRYEFTSVPTGERRQSQNAISNVPGLITFNAPQPTYTAFAPRLGAAFAPDEKTSIRAGFGLAYDVLFDNLGLLTSPPQFSQTNDVGSATGPAYLSANFLANGGLSSGLTPITSAAVAKAKTSAYLPNQILPYSINYNLTVQRTVGKDYTFEVQYLGTRGIHLPTQNQINVQPLVTTANQLTTYFTGPVLNSAGTYAVIATPTTGVNTLAAITSPTSYYVPAFYNNGFTTKITSYQPYGASNYNGLGLNLTRRFSHGLQTNLSYTYSRAMDDSTAEVNASALTERRPQDSTNQHAEYSRSALDRPQRFTAEAAYDFPFFKHSGFLLRNLASGWEVSPIFTYESPEFVTATSNTNSNLNGDSGGISRTIYNPNAAHNTVGAGLGSAVKPVYSSTLATRCTPPATICSANQVGYVAVNPNAEYVVAGKGTVPNQERNTLMGNPIDNLTMAAGKRLTFSERYSLEFQAQAFNVLNHSQFVPGNIDDIGGTSSTTSNTTLLNYLTPGNSIFNTPGSVYSAHARSLQLAAKFNF